MLPAALGYVALALPISRLIFQRGQTAAVDAETIAHTLQAFALGLPFFAAFQLLTRTFYSMQDSRTPALLNIAAATVNVGVDMILVVGLRMGVPAMALGHAASYLLGTLVLAWLLRRKLGSLDGRRVASTLARTVPAAVLTALCAAGVAALVGSDTAAGTATRVLQVVVGVGTGVLVFVGLAFILRVREVDEVRRALLARIGR
jgi:putative peptidoglycan lipid II flippase